MISFFRKFLTSWFALGLLGLVLIAFVVTGVGGNPFGSSSAGSGVAKVGSTELSEARLLTEFDRVMRRARESDPKLTARDAAKQGAVGEVLDQLIATTAIEQFGRDNGIAISDRAIDGEIASVDAFRVNGKFDPATYKRLLADQRLSERELRDGLHGDLIRKQVVTPVIAGSQVPRSMAAPYAALLLEKRDGAVAVVPAAAMPAPPAPTEAQVTAFYTAHAALYTTPERRGFRYALLDRDKLVATAAPVTDAEVQKYYDANKEQYGGVEIRQLAQVVVPDEARAKALVAAVKAGKPFAAAAAADGFAAADIDIGKQSQAKFAAATSPTVAAAAFAVPAGGITAPVKSAFGWHVVEAVKVEPPHASGLAAVRPAIVAKLGGDRAEQSLAETVGKIEDALSSSTSFADVAKTHGLTVVSVPPLTKAGTDPADPARVVPPAALPLVAKAFEVDPADGATLQQLGKDQFAMLELGDIVPPAPLPLAKVRPLVEAAWTADRRLAEARAVAAAIVADTAKSKDFTAAVAARKLPPPRPLGGRRIDLAAQQKVPGPVAAFLILPPGGTRIVPAPDGAGYIVVHVDKVTPGDLATMPQLVDGARQQFAQSAPDEISSAFAQAVERELGVKRNPTAVNAATARIVGDPGAAK